MIWERDLDQENMGSISGMKIVTGLLFFIHCKYNVQNFLPEAATLSSHWIQCSLWIFREAFHLQFWTNVWLNKFQERDSGMFGMAKAKRELTTVLGKDERCRKQLRSGWAFLKANETMKFQQIHVGLEVWDRDYDFTTKLFQLWFTCRKSMGWEFQWVEKSVVREGLPTLLKEGWTSF